MKILTIFMIFIHTFLSQSIPDGKKVTIWKLDNNNSLRAYETSLLSSILIKNDIPFEYKTVSSINELYKQIELANKKDDPYHIAISNIKITKEKEKLFSFSQPYFKSAYALMGKYVNFSESKTYSVGFVKGKFEKTQINSLLKKYQIKHALVSYKNFKDGMMYLKIDENDPNNSIHYFFSEYEDSFLNKNLKIVKVFGESDKSIGLMFPKNSQLKELIDPLLNGYLNSKMDQKYIKKYLGSAAVKYALETRK